MPLGNDQFMMTILDLIVLRKNDEMLRLFGKEGVLLRMRPEYYPNRMDKKYEDWFLPLKKVYFCLFLPCLSDSTCICVSSSVFSIFSLRS